MYVYIQLNSKLSIIWDSSAKVSYGGGVHAAYCRSPCVQLIAFPFQLGVSFLPLWKRQVIEHNCEYHHYDVMKTDPNDSKWHKWQVTTFEQTKRVLPCFHPNPPQVNRAHGARQGRPLKGALMCRCRVCMTTAGPADGFPPESQRFDLSRKVASATWVLRASAQA